MSTKSKVILLLVALTVAFAAGRCTLPAKVVTKTVTVEVEKKTDKLTTDTAKDTHKETVVTEEVAPNGAKTTTIRTIEDTKSDKKTADIKQDDTSIISTTTKETTYDTRKTTFNLLAGIPISFGDSIRPIFGASICRPILGPVTVGVWALSNATAGASLGLTF